MIDDDLDIFFGLEAELSFDAFDRLNSILVKFGSFDLGSGELVHCSLFEIALMSGSDCDRRASLLRYLRIGRLNKESLISSLLLFVFF